MSICFAPLLSWVLVWWRSDRLALAIDPTLKGDETTAIVISVLYRSCAIPSVPDTAWVGRGTAFSTAKAKRRCTLLVVWYSEQEEPWIILTDLAPDKVGPSWYALRFWIELGFKALKSRAGSGIRPAASARRVSPAIGWYCRWLPCWPWPTAPRWKTPRTAGLTQATCGRRPRRWLPITGTLVLVRRAPLA